MLPTLNRIADKEKLILENVNEFKKYVVEELRVPINKSFYNEKIFFIVYIPLFIKYPYLRYDLIDLIGNPHGTS